MREELKRSDDNDEIIKRTNELILKHNKDIKALAKQFGKKVEYETEGWVIVDYWNKYMV